MMYFYLSIMFISGVYVCLSELSVWRYVMISMMVAAGFLVWLPFENVISTISGFAYLIIWLAISSKLKCFARALVFNVLYIYLILIYFDKESYLPYFCVAFFLVSCISTMAMRNSYQKYEKLSYYLSKFDLYTQKNILFYFLMWGLLPLLKIKIMKSF